MDKKQFLKNFRRAVKELNAKPVLEDGHWLKFILGDGDKDRYDPIALVCIYLKQRYYSSEFKKAVGLIKISARLGDEINRAAFRHPVSYSRPLRRKLMRAAGCW